MKKSILIYSLVLILSLVSITFFGGSASYAFFFACILIPLVSFLYIFTVIKTLKIYQKTETRTMVAGDETGYFLTLQNSGIVTFLGVKAILFSDNFTVKDNIRKEPYFIPEGGKETFNTAISCNYRGQYPIGVESIVIYDFLNLFHITYRLPSVLSAIVNPRIIHMKSLKSLSSSVLSNLVSDTLGGDIIDASVREYQNGDNMSRVHWKAVAKTGELKVRNTFEEKKRGVLIFFEGRRVSKNQEIHLPYENKVLEIIVALNFYFSSESIPADTLYETKRKGNYSLESYHAGSTKDFDSFYNVMCEYAFFENEDEGRTLAKFFDRCSLLLPKVAYYVTSEISDELLIMTEKLSSYSVHVVIYVVTDKWDSRFEAFSSESRKIIMVPVEADIKDIL